jgi:hypothetical protein
MTDRKDSVKVMPLVLTEANAPAVTGWSFRYCCDVAQRRGVPIIRVSAHKSAIRADLFIAALERGNVTSSDVQGETPALADCGDPAAAVRALIGKKRVAGAK